MTRQLRDLGWLPIGILAWLLLMPLRLAGWLNSRGRLWWDSVRLGAIFVVVVFYALGLAAGAGMWAGGLR